MLQMNWWNLSFSPKYHPLQQARCTKTLQSPVTHIHGFLNRNQGKENSIKCSQNSSSFNLTNKIRNNKYSVPATLQKDRASRNEDDDNNSPSFQDVLQKRLNAVYRFARPFTQIGTIVGIASISILPLQSFADLTPKYFVGSLMALVSAMLMNTYVGTLNQLTDVEIDKVNKPHLSIASGDLSMETGIAITLICALLSLIIAIKLQSPPLVFGLIVWFLLGTAYSIDKYVLGRHVIITRPLIFTAAIICCFAVVMAFVKDIPDEEGDREFGIRTLCVRIGKERVFWLGVYMLSIAYGAGVIVGASSSSLLGKLVSIIGHSTAAVLLWLRTRTVDLSNSASTYSFYMFIWELFYAEYFLIHFLR